MMTPRSDPRVEGPCQMQGVNELREVQSTDCDFQRIQTGMLEG